MHLKLKVDDLENLNMHDLIKRYAYIENIFFTTGILDAKLSYLVKYKLINDVKDVIYYNPSIYNKTYFEERLKLIQIFLEKDIHDFLCNGPSTENYQLSLKLKKIVEEKGINELRMILISQSEMFYDLAFFRSEMYDGVTEFYESLECNDEKLKCFNKKLEKETDNLFISRNIKDFIFNIDENTRRSYPLPKEYNYSFYDGLCQTYEKLSHIINDAIIELENIKDVGLINYTKEILLSIKTIMNRYSSDYVCDENFKFILSKQNYNLLCEYNCLYILDYLFVDPIVECRIEDFKNFFNNTVITKIFIRNKEMNFSSLCPDKVIIMGFNECGNIKEVEEKIEFYRSLCGNKNCIYIPGKSNVELIVYLKDLKYNIIDDVS